MESPICKITHLFFLGLGFLPGVRRQTYSFNIVPFYISSGKNGNGCEKAQNGYMKLFLIDCRNISRPDCFHAIADFYEYKSGIWKEHGTDIISMV
jgi:hypothetical protein